MYDDSWDETIRKVISKMGEMVTAKSENVEVAETDAITETSINVTDEETAWARFHEIGKYVMRNKPVKPEGHKEDLFIGGFIMLMAGVAMLAPASYSSAGMMWGLLSGATFLSGTGILVVDSYHGRKTRGFQALVSRILLPKKALAKRLEQGKNYNNYVLTNQLYLLLVEKAKRQLEEEKVFELINHDNQTKFAYVTDTGEFQTLNRSQWLRTNSKVDDYATLNQRIATALTK